MSYHPYGDDNSWGQPKGGKKGGKGGKKGGKGDREWLSDEDFWAQKALKQCFVSDVPEDCDESQVKSAFGEAWIEHCKWLDKDGWSGKGFITFSNQEEAQAAAEKGSFDVNGTECFIEWSGARQRPASPAGGKDGKKGKKGGKDGKKGKKGGKKGGKDGKKGPPSMNATGFDASAVGKNKETFSDSDDE